MGVVIISLLALLFSVVSLVWIWIHDTPPHPHGRIGPEDPRVTEAKVHLQLAELQAKRDEVQARGLAMLNDPDKLVVLPDEKLVKSMVRRELSEYAAMPGSSIPSMSHHGYSCPCSACSRHRQIY